MQYIIKVKTFIRKNRNELFQIIGMDKSAGQKRINIDRQTGQTQIRPYTVCHSAVSFQFITALDNLTLSLIR